MSVLIQLFWTFFKIGLFSYGGGYVMIPFIQKEIITHSWLNPAEFADVVAISQMTPGPISVNAATYVGVRVAGFWGAFFATLGISLPSFILVVIIARFLIKFKENKIVNSVLQGIRPATIGLIGSAVIFLAEMSIFEHKILSGWLSTLFKGKVMSLSSNLGVNISGVVIFIVILVAVKKYRLHPVLAVVISGILGIVLT